MLLQTKRLQLQVNLERFLYLGEQFNKAAHPRYWGAHLRKRKLLSHVRTGWHVWRTMPERLWNSEKPRMVDQVEQTCKNVLEEKIYRDKNNFNLIEIVILSRRSQIYYIDILKHFIITRKLKDMLNKRKKLGIYLLKYLKDCCFN